MLLQVGCLLLAGAAAQADNMLQVSDGRVRIKGSPAMTRPGEFGIFGAELTRWVSLAPATSDYVRGVLQPMARSGANTVGVALQGAEGSGRFFTPDGRLADPAVGAAFKDFAFRTRDHGFALLVSAFSADRQYWLESAEAYREAVRTVAGLLPVKHSCILVVSDAFARAPWDPACPYPMQDRDARVELCKIAKRVRADLVLSLPVMMSTESAPGEERRAWLTVGQESQDLLTSNAADPTARQATLWDTQFLLQPPGSTNDVLQTFLKQVETRRLSIQRKPPVCSGPAIEEVLPSEEKADGFVPLFDGRTLHGWTTLVDQWGSWSIDSGMLRCAGDSGTWLRSTERFGSFILRLEFRVGPNGNSGVFIHAPYDGRASRFGMEVQIYGANRTHPDADTTGAIYAVLPPSQDSSKRPGEWNALEIAFRGTRLTVKLNDELVQDVDTAMQPGLKDRLQEGCIGLQDHGNPVWFRKIRIKSLDLSPTSEPHAAPSLPHP